MSNTAFLNGGWNQILRGRAHMSMMTRTRFFYVIEGIVSMLIGDKWTDAGKGAFIRIPRNTIHSFANRTNEKAGFLNFNIPGGFEKDMPSMEKWFEENR